MGQWVNTGLDDQVEPHPLGHPTCYREIVGSPATTGSHPFVTDVASDLTAFDTLHVG